MLVRTGYCRYIKRSSIANVEFRESVARVPSESSGEASERRLLRACYRQLLKAGWGYLGKASRTLWIGWFYAHFCFRALYARACALLAKTWNLSARAPTTSPSLLLTTPPFVENSPYTVAERRDATHSGVRKITRRNSSRMGTLERGKRERQQSTKRRDHHRSSSSRLAV